MYYQASDDVQTYREGPFASMLEARRAAAEVDVDMVPMEIWIEQGSTTVWRFSRRHAVKMKQLLLRT
ncbi:MAG: hypothetical protein K6T83_14205 [Alicyclobacillus sp.]|nr:hypothetical protein [Alicyclobacillus sp.]